MNNNNYYYVLDDSVQTVAEIILDHKRKFLYSDNENCYRITVRRCHIFEDAMVAIRRGFDEQKHLKVIFIGEPAVDDGGPRREFFVLEQLQIVVLFLMVPQIVESYGTTPVLCRYVHVHV